MQLLILIPILIILFLISSKFARCIESRGGSYSLWLIIGMVPVPPGLGTLLQINYCISESIARFVGVRGWDYYFWLRLGLFTTFITQIVLIPIAVILKSIMEMWYLSKKILYFFFSLIDFIKKALTFDYRKLRKTVSRLFKTKKEYPKGEKGSVVYCDLLEFIEHSGVFLGDNKIAHLNGDGEYEVVSFKTFVERLWGINPTISIFISYKDGEPVGDKEIYKRAKKKLNKKTTYNLFSNNCHRFTAYCITGDEHNDITTWIELKEVAQQYLQSYEWYEYQVK